MSEALSDLRPLKLGALAEEFAEIALEAGEAIMSIYGRPCATREKKDHSPVTEADEVAEAIILNRLERLLPGVPVVAEESLSRGRVPRIGREFLLVDALDGTLEFLKLNGEFTVNLALVRDGRPVCGAVYAPALGQIWFAGEAAVGATIGVSGRLPPDRSRARLSVRTAPRDGLVALLSRSHCDPKTEVFLQNLPLARRRKQGSSLKFCMIAAGEADVYPRFSATMEWDTAAGDAILRAAGGKVVDSQGADLRYGKQGDDFRNDGFVAWGDRTAARLVRP